MATMTMPVPMTSREKVLRLVTENPLLNNRELASLLDISRQRVHQIIQSEGINKKELREQWFEDQKELIKMFEQAQSGPAIAIHPLHPEVVLPEQYTK